MSTIEVRTQAELEKAIEKAGVDDLIEIHGDGHFEFRVTPSALVAIVGSSSPRMVAWGSSSPRMEAWGSSSPRMEARESSSPSMVARESSSPSSTIGKWAGAILWHEAGASFADIVDPAGHAVLLEIPTIDTPELWCEYRGAEPDADGLVVLYKAVDDDWKSGRGFAYEPGTTPEAPDWDEGAAECGGGLHFCASPLTALGFFPEATRFVGCPVRLDEIVVHRDPMFPEKVKAPRVAGPIFEVDRHGERVESAKAAS